MSWLTDQAPAADDLIVFNNSYLFRQGISTTKNDQYLACRVGDDGTLRTPASVVTLSNFNADFKLFRAKSSMPEAAELQALVDREIARLGQLVFILVGAVDDTVTTSETLNHRDFDELIVDPTLDRVVTVEGRRITVRETTDEERIWEELTTGDLLVEEIDHEALRNAVGTALDKLDERAYARLLLPTRHADVPGTAIDQILAVLRDQRNEYQEALSRCDGDPDKDRGAFNEVLRVAYNFSSDALGLVRLIVSICDLKAVVLWGTIGEHFALAEAFRALPWVRSNQKPSLKGYVDTIGEARNAAFHNLFPFRKTLEVDLPTDSLQNVNLRIFSEHSKKRHNELRFEDKELVDVLVEFTRARYRRVTPRFWRQNLEVMNATIELFDSTGRYLRLLNAQRQ